MKYKEYKQKRASLDDAYLFGEITLSDYARESQNLDTKYYQIENDRLASLVEKHNPKVVCKFHQVS